MGLRGLVDLKKFTFMLDSGASSNFVSESIARDLGLRYKTLTSRTVRLADGKLIQTVGQVQIPVMFGGYKYHGKFFVLQGEVLLILGMDFLVSVQPQVDWKEHSVVVYIGNRRFSLPTCTIGSVESSNSFAGLTVDDVVHTSSEDAALEAEQEAKRKAVKTDQRPSTGSERGPGEVK